MSLRPTYANVVSTLALALVLSGGAYAATQLPKNSVGTKQIQKNAVTTKKVKDGNLQATDLAAGQIASGLKGTPMGGDLSGTFPNPTVDIPSLNGVVKGDRLTATVSLAGGSGFQPVLNVPGLGTLSADCAAFGGDRELDVNLLNTSGTTIRYTLHRLSEAPTQNTVNGGVLAPGNTLSTAFPANSLGDNARYQGMSVVSGPPVVLELTALTNTPGGSCAVRAVAFIG